MKKLKGIIGVVALTGLVAFGGYRVWEAYHRQAAAKTKGGQRGGRVVSVSLAEAQLGQVRQEVLLAGALKPKERVDVTAKVTGRVERIHFQVGDRVRKGDLIAVLDDDELAQQVTRANAALAVAKAAGDQREAELANSRADLVRFEALFKQGLIARREIEAYQTATRVVESQLQLARAQERQAQAELKELEIRREQTRIFAPMDGWVAQRYVDVGALVNASTPVIHLVNLATMVAVANVPESEVGKLRVGTRTEVQVDALGDTTFGGRVARIGPVLDAATRSAAVEIEIPNPDGRLKAEMFARVKLDVASFRQALLIPREALVYRGDQPGVYLARNGEPEFRTVETGTSQGDRVEVTANLQPGARIVATGASMLTEGDRIQVAGGGGKKAKE